jgi:hypothetical protein
MCVLRGSLRYAFIKASGFLESYIEAAAQETGRAVDSFYGSEEKK